jgi:hypothetical protein
MSYSFKGLPPSITTIVYRIRPAASKTFPSASQTMGGISGIVVSLEPVLTLDFTEKICSPDIDGKIKDERNYRNISA